MVLLDIRGSGTYIGSMSKLEYPADYVDKIICGDCLEVMKGIPDGVIDAVITDPPYPREFEYLYEAMAKESKRILRIGGSLLTLCGHSQLPRVLTDIGKHLKYRWIIQYDQPGSYARLSMGILATWKPLLWFVNDRLTPRRCITDKAYSQKREKNNHPWEQSSGYAEYGVTNLTDTGQVILDPFIGSGTTAVVCKNMNRHFVGIEIDPEYCKIAEDRLRQGVL